MKFIVLLAVLMVAMWVWNHNRKQAIAQREQEAAMQRMPAPMVQCRHCGVHVAQKQAVQNEQGDWFCSLEHAKLGVKQHV